MHVGDVVCRSNNPELIFDGLAGENEIISYHREEQRRVYCPSPKYPHPSVGGEGGPAGQTPKSSGRTLQTGRLACPSPSVIASRLSSPQGRLGPWLPGIAF